MDNFKRVVGQIAELSAECGMKEESEIFYCYRMISQMYDACGKQRSSYDIRNTVKLIQKVIRMVGTFSTIYAWRRCIGK